MSGRCRVSVCPARCSSSRRTTDSDLGDRPHVPNCQRGDRARLTWDVVREIRASGLNGADIGRAYGIAGRHACKILANEAWHDPDYAGRVIAPKFTADVVAAIEAVRRGERSQVSVRREFGLSAPYVCQLVKGQRGRRVLDRMYPTEEAA
jgi:hypothetical protein